MLVLDVLRHRPEYRKGDAVADGAVETLLRHWEVREPTGPCHWGIGTTFLRVDYPFLKYNLFFYVYVLSFFAAARRDPRFREAYDLLESKLDASGSLVVENPHRRLGRLRLCTRGQPSVRATARFNEVRDRVGAHPGPGDS